MDINNWKQKIQNTWQSNLPFEWEKHVQNVYAVYYQLRQQKYLHQDDRSRHWRQYLRSEEQNL